MTHAQHAHADPAQPALARPLARFVSPLGDSREHSVPCLICLRSTLTLDAICIPCSERNERQRGLW